MDLSIVIPVYNNKVSAIKSSRSLNLFLSRHFREFEIIIVDDGSTADQRLKREEFPSRVQILRNITNKGKGAAVKNGMLSARGKCRVYTDADLPYDLQSILSACKLIFSNKAACVAGDRTHPLSINDIKESAPRIYASIMFRHLTKLFITGKHIDTQCGFKAFSESLTASLFPVLTVDRFAFDIEIFYLLIKNNIPFTVIPVTYSNSKSSSVNIFFDGLKTSFDAFLIPIKWRLKYYPEKLSSY